MDLLLDHEDVLVLEEDGLEEAGAALPWTGDDRVRVQSASETGISTTIRDSDENKAN